MSQLGAKEEADDGMRHWEPGQGSAGSGSRSGRKSSCTVGRVEGVDVLGLRKHSPPRMCPVPCTQKIE